MGMSQGGWFKSYTYEDLLCAVSCLKPKYRTKGWMASKVRGQVTLEGVRGAQGCFRKRLLFIHVLGAPVSALNELLVVKALLSSVGSVRDPW